MSLFRPALLFAVAVSLAGALTGCKSDTKTAAEPSGGSGPGTPTVTSAPAAPPSPTPAACPSRAQIADALGSDAGLSKVTVSANVVCDDGWATVPIQVRGADPARAIVRRKAGRVRLVTYGTDGLCDNPAMRPAPSKVKKALGPYC